jgi:hypothetical protein
MISIVNSELLGKTIGWKMLRGIIGVRTNAFTPGSRTGPPADME